MSRIRSENTSPELLVRKGLWARGHRYRLYASLPGKPDLVFAGKRVVVFLDGCFWHGCPSHYREPRSNAAYWCAKIERNVARDLRVTKELVRDGWIVLRFWEHQVKKELPMVLAAVEGTLSTAARAAQEDHQ